jgi:hypothetical protein
LCIDEGVGAPSDGIGKSVAEFAGAAAAGQFAVNQSGGDASIAAIRKLTTWINEEQGSLRFLEQEPKLGSSNAARVMKPCMRQVAIDAQGFLTQLLALRDVLMEAESAIRQAMRNHQEADEASAGKFTNRNSG